MSDLKNNKKSKHVAEDNGQSINELVDAAQAKVTQDNYTRTTRGAVAKRHHLPVWVPILAWLVFAAFFVMHYGQIVNPFPKPDLRQIEHSTRLEMISVADYLDQWRSDHGELPNDLPEFIDIRDLITYQNKGDRYSLSVAFDGKILNFKESEDKTAFLKGALTD